VTGRYSNQLSYHRTQVLPDGCPSGVRGVIGVLREGVKPVSGDARQIPRHGHGLRWASVGGASGGDISTHWNGQPWTIEGINARVPG
jgi:hypothetical protein